MPRVASILLVLSGILPSVSNAAVDFETEVKPILASRCYGCHGAEKQKAGVAMHTQYHAHLPTEGGKGLFVAGKPEDSLAFQQMIASDPDKRMPKGKPALSPKEINYDPGLDQKPVPSGRTMAGGRRSTGLMSCR